MYLLLLRLLLHVVAVLMLIWLEAPEGLGFLTCLWRRAVGLLLLPLLVSEVLVLHELGVLQHGKTGTVAGG